MVSHKTIVYKKETFCFTFYKLTRAFAPEYIIINYKPNKMYIVIETFDPLWPAIQVDPDNGMPLIFETEEEAQKEANECQNGIVVKVK